MKRILPWCVSFLEFTSVLCSLMFLIWLFLTLYCKYINRSDIFLKLTNAAHREIMYSAWYWRTANVGVVGYFWDPVPHSLGALICIFSIVSFLYLKMNHQCFDVWKIPILKCIKFLLQTLGLFIIPGITNYEEYSLIQESVEEKKEESTGTLKKDRTLLRDERKMEKLKAKLHTDDDCE